MIMKPVAPAAIRFSIAWTWLSLSPSCLPAKDCSSAPASAAAASAPSFILTKNGLVSVLVIRPITTPSALPPPSDPSSDDPESSSEPHAASTKAAAAATATAASLRCVLSMSNLQILPDQGVGQRCQAHYSTGIDRMSIPCD